MSDAVIGVSESLSTTGAISNPVSTPVDRTSRASAAAETRTELQRLRLVGMVMALAGVVVTAAATAFSQLERIAPWVAGEGVPIARLFDDTHSSAQPALPGFAEASTDNAAAEFEASALVASARPHDATPADGAPAPVSGPAAGIAPNEYEGVTQPIEGTEHLSPFFKQLRRTLRREERAITRIAHYGDSAVAADSITSTARRLLQGRLGDAGHGFILIARGPMQFYMHRDIVHRSAGPWEVSSIVHGRLRDGRYGYGGVLTLARAGASASFGTVEEGTIGTRASRFSLYYQRARGGGSVQVRADGETIRTISTAGGTTEDAVETIEVPDGPHVFALRATGGVSKLYGVALEREGPGVVYDSLGLVGAMAERLLGANAAHVKEQLEQRDPQLLVLAFGGNESANRWLNLERYESELVRVVKQMRAGREDMACMLFGPLDQGERDKRGQVVTVEVLPKIVEVQRKVAAQHGCAFFDAYLAMGGEGTMARWIKARPRLATSDMRHATPAGYEVVGTLYYKALLRAFAEYLAR